MSASAHKLRTTIAVRYLDAARVIHKNSPAPNALWEPLNHLFAMSAELALKAFLEGEGVSQKELKKSDIRHSLSTLLVRAVRHGLRTSGDVADVLMRMDDAHSSYFYRYIPRPEESQVVTVYAAYPAVALAAIQRLLDHCAVDPEEVRKHSALPEEWPAAALPVRPITVDELQDRIAATKRLRTSFGDNRHGTHTR